jgi:hypothetical protein
LLPLALLPQCLLQRRLPARRRWELIGAALLTATVVMAPWVARNLTTFDRPVFLADNSDSVIAGANCADTYSGPDIGSWYWNCNAAHLPRGDQSVESAALRTRGLNYAGAHLSRLPVVVAARVGRTWDVFRPFQGLAETRSRWMRGFGVLAFWLIVPFAAFGAVIARRRSMSLAPFVGATVVVIVASTLGYGLWRLRLPLDVAAITLAGVGIANLRRAPVDDHDESDRTDGDQEDRHEESVATDR